MCGIVGTASNGGRVDAGLLIRMRDSLRHRGPDDSGSYLSPDGGVGLGHRRLSIIDLSPRGRQPMCDASGRYWIVFNGEIYNYRRLRKELESAGFSFRTETDTEVLLTAYQAWGRRCLQRFNGMFALAIYDSLERRIFLARDRAGEKPIFYRHAAHALTFASELKAILADPDASRRLDLDSLGFLLAYGFVPGERCILSGIQKLGQGQALLYDIVSDTLEKWTYWQLPAAVRKGDAGATADLLDELERLLDDSVDLRLVADVPVGILLSGGLDSSLIAASAARLRPGGVRTFTVSFPGHGRFDEGPYARAVAAYLGMPHTELVAEAGSVDVLPLLARAFDEPIADSSMVPTYLLSRLVREHVTVALGGDGGDELFGGYLHYSWLLRQASLRSWVPGWMRRAASAMAARFLPVGTRGRNHMIGLSGDVAWSIAHVNVYFDERSRRGLLRALMNGLARPDDGPERFKAALGSREGGIIEKATTVDFRCYLPDDILVKVDRASMLNSLEVRSPWLDPRIIEYAFALPETLRASKAGRKVLLRMLGRKRLPPDLDLRRKQGFTLPLGRWFRDSWGSYMESVLLESDWGVFDIEAIRHLIRWQKMGLRNEDRLFALTMLELWRKEYRITI